MQPEESTEKDPLLEDNNLQDLRVDSISMIRIKSEPASEDEDRAENLFSDNKCLERMPESSNPQHNFVVVSFFQNFCRLLKFEMQT